MADPRENEESQINDEGNYRDGKGERQGEFGEQFGNDYGFGRRGEHTEPEGYGYGHPQESEFVNQYDPPEHAGMPLDEGPHAGRGPRNCEDSQGELFDEVCLLLTRHGQLDASEVEVDTEDGSVSLSGRVSSPDQKRLAEQLAGSVNGVFHVENRLEVS